MVLAERCTLADDITVMMCGQRAQLCPAHSRPAHSASTQQEDHSKAQQQSPRCWANRVSSRRSDPSRGWLALLGVVWVAELVQHASSEAGNTPVCDASAECGCA